MTRSLSRRAFLGAGGSALLVVACGGPPLIKPDSRAPTPSSGLVTPVGGGVGPRSTPVPTVSAGSTVLPNAYVAVAPKVLRSRQTEPISITLLRDDQPATDNIQITLSNVGGVVASATSQVNGRGAIPLSLPNLASGSYNLEILGTTFRDHATIQVEESTVLFVESDKPVYQPGQIVHLRAIALDSQLKPVPASVVVEVADAKGTKIFRKTVALDDFGMAAVDLPLSSEPNLGVWKVVATAGKRTAQVEVRVERYVLPKYEVQVDLAKSWALPNDAVKGTVTATYSFGKPVEGDLEISAFRYVGTWEKYATVTKPIVGKVAFDLPPVGYAAGTAEGGGAATIRLEIAVREIATNDVQSVTELVTIAASPIAIQVIPDSTQFKPTLPLTLLIVTQTPDKKSVDTNVDLQLGFADLKGQSVGQKSTRIATRGGIGSFTVVPPASAVGLSIEAREPGGGATRSTLRASYSPSGNFVHLQPLGSGPLKVGDLARFKIFSTHSSKNYYVEVLARGAVLYSDVTSTDQLDLTLTPGMAPDCRLLVYQILPNAEVAADYVPLKVSGSYPHQVQLTTSQSEVKPGDDVDVSIQTEGLARVGLAAVDRSVFILAENRLNLQQVFDELERQFLVPQAQVINVQPIGIVPTGLIPGARETFADAGVVVLTNRSVPAGLQPPPPPIAFARGIAQNVAPGVPAAPAPPSAAAPAGKAATASQADAATVALATVQRVRQFFPETWLWSHASTDGSGHLTQRVTAPDTITTWAVRAVALSKDKGLGIADAELRVFQPFFVQPDLPYAATRGEELPVKLALYNYRPVAQDFVVDLGQSDWFDLLGGGSTSVTVGPNGVGAATFTIRPTGLGPRSLKVSARSQLAADAVVKEVLIEAEGLSRENVENAIIAPGVARDLDFAIPVGVVAGSERRFLTVTGNTMTQSIGGLDGLLQMPYGCGEQNMILFAPDVYVAQYLKDTRQGAPEILAKAETLMLTGYQRELTYRRADGSFSAFGQQDQEGSLWLTAFVLKTFAQARDLIYIDDQILTAAADWIRQYQKADGSFDAVGFLHHQDLLGGLRGKTALTAFTTIALNLAGDTAAVGNAVAYLESVLNQTTDAYALATATYALGLAKSQRAGDARAKLLAIARTGPDGTYWGDDVFPPQPMPVTGGAALRPILPPRSSASIETTAYAALALIQLGDSTNAGSAQRWLVSRRNATGGFGTTQDTVVALQALATGAKANQSNVDATLTLRATGWNKTIRVTSDNGDVLQLFEVPAVDRVTVESSGTGSVVLQTVRRFNVPSPEVTAGSAFQLDVRYSADHVAIDDLVHVTASVVYSPAASGSAGMIVLDISIPTGFVAVPDSIAAAVKRDPRLKRWDLAGRKVILYVEDMLPGERRTVEFDVRAAFPVRARPATSQVYSYYQPEQRAEALSNAMSIA